VKPAILTKYHGPTKHRDARVKAYAEDCSAYYGWNPDLSAEANHYAAAHYLAAKMGWLRDEYGVEAFYLAGGTLPKLMGGYCYVLEDHGDY
jgi:hypothetical protein